MLLPQTIAREALPLSLIRPGRRLTSLHPEPRVLKLKHLRLEAPMRPMSVAARSEESTLTSESSFAALHRISRALTR
jgi:hypothetical protein